MSALGIGDDQLKALTEKLRQNLDMLTIAEVTRVEVIVDTDRNGTSFRNGAVAWQPGDIIDWDEE